MVKDTEAFENEKRSEQQALHVYKKKLKQQNPERLGHCYLLFKNFRVFFIYQIIFAGQIPEKIIMRFFFLCGVIHL